jgi:hypothetical protein
MLKVFAIGVVVFASLEARAGPCQKDTDCKGDRVCEKGKCVSPSGGGAAKSDGAPAGLFEPANSDNGPSLADTFKFIEGNLEGLRATFTRQDTDTQGISGSAALATSYAQVRHQGCVLRFRTTMVVGSQQPSTYDDEIDFKTVDPASLRVAQQPQQKDSDGMTTTISGWYLYYAKSFHLDLGDNGQDVGTHLANAFGRAAQLCGAKASPF